MTPPAVVTVTVVSKVMNSDGICAGMRRVARSRSAQNATETSANSEILAEAREPRPDDDEHADEAGHDRRASAASRPARRISRAAPSVIASGSAWKIAEVLASGRCTIAAMNEIVPPISPTTRSATGFSISVRSGRSAR